jgi:hypothetical protein
MSCSLSCFFRVAVPLEGFFWRMPSRPTLYRAERHTPMGRMIWSYALEPSRGIVRLLHMGCPS